jgi:hypothetical protein
MENAVNGDEEAEAEEEEYEEEDEEPTDVLQMPRPEPVDDYVPPPINLAHLRAYEERERLRQEKKKLKLVSDEEVIERTGDERLVPRPTKSDKLPLQPTYHGFKRTRRLSHEFR